MKTRTFGIKGFTEERKDESLWNAFHVLICAMPTAAIDTHRDAITLLAKSIDYPEDELNDLCEFGYISPEQEEETIRDMMILEEELTYGN